MVAPTVAHEGWAERSPTLAQALTQLTAKERVHLDARWEAIAALEHSSVASFARATLELMALSAPADLLLETQLAAADEVRHAQEVYGWLSTLRGELVGPGAFPSAHLSPRVDSRALALSLAREACLGETLGVAELGRALCAVERAGGPQEIRAHLLMVLADETRHAALAWRTLEWLLQGASARLLDEVAELLSASLMELLTPSAREPYSPRLSAFGVLNESERLLAYREAAEEVVLPSLIKLLGTPRAMRLGRVIARAA